MSVEEDRIFTELNNLKQRVTALEREVKPNRTRAEAEKTAETEKTKASTKSSTPKSS